MLRYRVVREVRLYRHKWKCEKVSDRKKVIKNKDKKETKKERVKE